MAETSTITTRVKTNWAHIACEYDRKAAAEEIVRFIVQQLEKDAPDAANISYLARAIARHGVVFLQEKLAEELEAFSLLLLTKAANEACLKFNNEMLEHGESAYEVARLNNILNEGLKGEMVFQHQRIWGKPPQIPPGRPPKSPNQKTAEWVKKREELIARYTAAIIFLIETNQKRKPGKIAEEAYPRAKKNSRPVLLAQDAKKYEIDLESLIRATESESQRNSLSGN